MKFYAQIIRGKLVLSDRAKFYDFIRGQKDSNVIVAIQRPQSQRTISQNSYYWQLLKILGDEIGEHPEKLHNDIKEEFLSEHIHSNLFNKDKKIIKSTTELNTKEFSEYIEKIKHWASEFLNVYLPDANEVYE